ncbi:MAG TPA: hypothetical protein VGH28_00785 [Polyangiaceae bacterium]|jgi:hypothetical protein
MRAADVAFCAVVACAFACHDSNKSDAAPAVSIANVTFSAAPGGSVHVTPEPHGPTVCRVIELRGGVDQKPVAPKNGEPIGEGFATLASGAHLAIKNGTTTRETIFDGPGSVRSCVSGEEEFWMPTGAFTSVFGAGDTPGSEVWIVTPHVVVRYGSGAQIKVLSSTSKANVKLTSGGAWAFPIGSMTPLEAGTPHEQDGWVEVPGNGSLEFVSKRAPSQVVGECELAAKKAHDLAIAIGTRDASLSDAAPKHVVARRRAHALCSVAELVADTSLDPVERERLLPLARAGSTRWRDSSANP